MEDALSKQEARELLVSPKVIRDPLHGDIHVTPLERDVIDTPEFQRLRGINQLAMTYMAYPGAVHTRFIHSIGVLHVATEMISSCNENVRTHRAVAGEDDPVPVSITPYQQIVARLAALMHDMAHVPFGHTFEKEAHIFDEDEWQDKWRTELIFGPDGSLAKVLAEQPISKQAAERIRTDVRQLLEIKRDHVWEKVHYPFLHDLVGNTICADLVDYVQRDMLFCGLKERTGDRFLQYVAVVPVLRAKNAENAGTPIRKGESAFPTRMRGSSREGCRLTLAPFRYDGRGNPRQKADVIREAIDLVRRRQAVAEKLYFHRTKMAASAMLATAASTSGLTARGIWDLSDHEVLKSFAANEHPRTKKLGENLLARHLFKPIYSVSYVREGEGNASDLLWKEPDGVYPRFMKPERRDALIAKLERAIGLKAGMTGPAFGTVAISCPDKKMNLKALDVLIWKGSAEPLNTLSKSLDSPVTREIEAINETHKHLWKFEVFVDPEAVDLDPANDFTLNLIGALRHELSAQNELEKFSAAPSHDLDKWLKEVEVDARLEHHGIQHIIQVGERQDLLAESFLTGSSNRGQKIDAFLRTRGIIERKNRSAKAPRKPAKRAQRRR